MVRQRLPPTKGLPATKGNGAQRRRTSGFWQPVAWAAYLLLAFAGGGVWLWNHTVAGLGPDAAFDWNLFRLPLWTIAIGSTVNITCALLGCYLVLRRMSLLGDAISHAVLPGLAVAFLLTGSLTGWPMFVGAVVIGILTSVLTQAIAGLGKVSEDTSMGVVFTSLFALGVILVMGFAAQAHIDADCILYGQIEYVAVDLPPPPALPIPRSIWTLASMLLVTLLFVAGLWKELKFVAFDPALAAAMGFSVPAIHYALMAMVAAASVASFEVVGSILVVAMLIVPATAAALVTDRLRWMLAWAAAFGIVSALFGYLAAAQLDTSVAGMMAVVAGLQLTGAVFLSPRHGLASRWLRNLALAVRIASEDVIARLYRLEERGQWTGASVGNALRGAPALVGDQRSEVRGQEPTASRFVRWLAGLRLARRGWITRDRAREPRLTDAGRAAARNLVRAHRLWETYLDTHFDLPRDHLHEAAERMEHFLDPKLQAELDAELAGVSTDPHGKAIPPAQ
ncbi:MAG: metal ABC transporter permease [Pirellulaceae bacterium]